MANYPYGNEFLAPLPAYPVREFCGRISDDNLNDTQLMVALQAAVGVYANYTGTVRCLDIESAYDANMGDAQWFFQVRTAHTCARAIAHINARIPADRRARTW